MEQHDTVVFIILGIMVFSIVLYANERFIGSKLPENLAENLSQPLVLSVTNEKIAGGVLGPVEVTPRARDAGGYLYEITATPQVKITGEREAPVDIIAILTFKGQSIRATFSDPSGDSDKFTLKHDDVITLRLRADIISDIMPLQEYTDSFHNERFSNKMPVLVRSGRSAVIATVNVDEYVSVDYVYDSNPINLYDCKATFSLEGPCTQKYSNRLNGTPESPLSERHQTIEICGGAAEIWIYQKPDCSARTVNAEIDYGCSNRGGRFCGEEWQDAGESVYLSFWKDNECTRQTSDFYQLLGLCREHRLGGEFKLNAGCIDKPGKNCFS